MENVSGEHQASESHVDGEHPAVTRIASVFHAAVVFLFLKLDEFAVKGFRIVRAVVFHVDPGIEHKLYGIAVAAQVDSPVDSGPDRVAETFAAAVIDTADEACRYRLFFILVAEQCALFALRKTFPKAGVAPRVVENLFRAGDRFAVIFEKERGRFECS